MKHLHNLCMAILLCVSISGSVLAQEYTNFVRQVQYPTGLVWDANINETGEQLSELAIDPGGARFELWTVNNSPLAVYLLDSTYVGTYTPVASSRVITEDITGDNVTPRTRADRPYQIAINVSGLLNGDTDPAASKAVRMTRHVQSYGINGNGVNIDPNQATLLSQVELTENGDVELNYSISSIPSTNLSKIRGEETFAIYSLEDYQAPSSQISASKIQIWPVTTGGIVGISAGETIRYKMPQLTVTLDDLYPTSTTYAQVYMGSAALATSGTVVPGSAIIVNEASSVDRVLIIDNYDDVITRDGTWTIELLTQTVFGVDRLSYMTFEVDRTMQVRGAFTTTETGSD